MELHLKRLEKCKLELWDSSGDLCFESMLRPYFKSCHCVLVVYQPAVPGSFEVAKQLVIEVGAKALLVANSEAAQPETETYCAQTGWQFIQVSPATSSLLFQRAAQAALC